MLKCEGRWGLRCARESERVHEMSFFSQVGRKISEQNARKMSEISKGEARSQSHPPQLTDSRLVGYKPNLEMHPRKALGGGIQKSILTDFLGNVGDSRKMLTKTS